MDSETEVPEPTTLIERLINSRNRALSLFLPIILGFTNNTTTTTVQDLTDQDQEQQDPTNPSRDRIILINPLTQGMVVIESSSSRFDSLLNHLLSKDGQPPASKASIEAMPSVEIREEEEEGGCVVCLEDWEVGGGVVKEMPCKHKFHGVCIEKWLGIHGSCPVCRYKMPVDDDDDVSNKSGGVVGGGGERGGGTRREIWVSFSLGSSERRRGDNTNQMIPMELSDDDSSSPRPDHDNTEG